MIVLVLNNWRTGVECLISDWLRQLFTWLKSLHSLNFHLNLMRSVIHSLLVNLEKPWLTCSIHEGSPTICQSTKIIMRTITFSCGVWSLIMERFKAENPLCWMQGAACLQYWTNNGHVTGPTPHYDVIDFVFVAEGRDRAAQQRRQNQWRHQDKSVKGIAGFSMAQVALLCQAI